MFKSKASFYCNVCDEEISVEAEHIRASLAKYQAVEDLQMKARDHFNTKRHHFKVGLIIDDINEHNKTVLEFIL